MKNEKTSKRTASSASYVMDEKETILAILKRVQRDMATIIKFTEEAASCAASALTQAQDKKKK